VATDDGSLGHHGFVTELLEAELEPDGHAEVYACGPPAMLEAVRALCAGRGVPAQLALESGMACGFGACYGCVVPVRGGGYLRVCVDGPVVDGRAAHGGAGAVTGGAGGSVLFCGLELAHPVVNGSGTFDAIAARRAFGDALLHAFPFSAFVSKTITLEPRAGNPPPRLWEAPAGLINSIGLPNRGLAGYLAEDLPQLAQLPVPLITNVMGSTAAELCALVEAVEERQEVAAIELNVSCPNVKTGLDIGADPDTLADVLTDVRPRTAKPLIVKLTPNTADVAAVALAAQEAGADAVSLINTLRAFASAGGRPGEPWLGGGTGGLSGPAVRTVALAQVLAVARRVAIPIVGMGGVQTAEHAAQMLAAGATLVAVGTESFRDPLAGAGSLPGSRISSQRAGTSPMNDGVVRQRSRKRPANRHPTLD
jgi:dihydroorotate dehydrogenase (NAD+) catalytic subunit